MKSEPELKVKVDMEEVQLAINKCKELKKIVEGLNSEVEKLSRQFAHMVLDVDVVDTTNI